MRHGRTSRRPEVRPVIPRHAPFPSVTVAFVTGGLPQSPVNPVLVEPAPGGPEIAFTPFALVRGRPAEMPLCTSG